MKTLKIRLPLAALAILAALVVATPAAAQSGPQLDGYSDEAGQIQDNVAGNQAAGDDETNDVAPVTATSGSLPFTGLDLALIAGAGGCLLLLGLGLRRLTHAPHAP